MPKNQRASSAQYAYESMKDWVLSGFLKPGERIDQDEAAEKLSVSRMPVRSALDRLNAEGLVVKTPYRGVVVSPLDDKVFNDLFDARCQIEAMSIITLVPIITNDEIDMLYNMLQIHADGLERNLTAMLDENRMFHRRLIKLANNDVLLQLFDTVWEQSERYRRIYYRTPHSNVRIIKEHHEIVDTIALRKPQAAADMIVDHARKSQQHILEVIGKEMPDPKYKVFYQEPK